MTNEKHRAGGEPLRLQIDTENYTISGAERERMESAVERLHEQIDAFPVTDLHFQLHRHPRSGDFHVKARLRVPSTTLFTGERGEALEACFDDCLRKLAHKVERHKERLEDKERYQKRAQGTDHDLFPSEEPDIDEAVRAIESGDYRAFREAMAVYDDAISLRAGRWIERYPDAAAEVGHDILLTDLVDEVMLNAFARWYDRPKSRRLGQWLEDLIDPSIETLLSPSIGAPRT